MGDEQGVCERMWGRGSLLGNAIQASPDLFSQASVVIAAESAFVFVR